MENNKCPNCNGRGTYMLFGSPSKCSRCNGKGNVQNKPTPSPERLSAEDQKENILSIYLHDEYGFRYFSYNQVDEIVSQLLQETAEKDQEIARLTAELESLTSL